MKSLLRAFTCATVFFCFANLTPRAQAVDAGPSLGLERYTVLSDGEIQHDDGNMLGNGHFRILYSQIYDSMELDPNFDYEAISGRPICFEEVYNGYKAQGIIPHWTRSRYDFQIGSLNPPYVIVSVVGGQDPNPTITIAGQPESQNVLAGEPAFFFVDANPIEYLSFQWFHNGTPLKGETMDILLLNNIAPAQSGNYTVTMTTGGKKVSSKKALLRVVSPVAIKTAPRSQTVQSGHGVVFRVAALGTGPFAYQWYFNGNPISQATRSFYSIPKTTGSDAGSYAVAVSNGASLATSAAAVLIVNP